MMTLFNIRKIMAAAVFSAAMGASMPAHSQSQALSATPIEFDLSAADSASAPLLITAYKPQLGIAPQSSFSGLNEARMALTPDATLPRPSIILGRIEVGQEDVFGIEGLLPATVAKVGFSHTDLEARTALRDANPILFRKLIEGGYVDPSEVELKAALQTELARMNCHRFGIDGAWGPKSRGSVTAYFAASEGVDWPNQKPTQELFRTIILREDVRCATPVAKVVRRRVTSSKPRGTASRPAATQKPRTPKPATTPRRIPKVGISLGGGKVGISLGGGIGVFR